LAQWEKEKAKWDEAHRDLADEEKVIEFLKSDLGRPSLTSEFSFQTSLRNTGEVTIDDFLLSVSVTFGTDLTVQIEGGPIIERGAEQRFRMPGQRTMTGQGSYPKTRIFPGDQLVFPDRAWRVEVPHGKSLDDSNLMMRWVAYLEDSPPSSGELDAAAELSRLLPSQRKFP
jgi:hypothetical protein